MLSTIISSSIPKANAVSIVLLPHPVLPIAIIKSWPYNLSKALKRVSKVLVKFSSVNSNPSIAFLVIDFAP